MENDIPGLAIEFSNRTLRLLVDRIDICLAKLNHEQIWARGGSNENAIGNLVLHLCGNVRQWVVSGVGGAADTRTRDAEFAAQSGAAGAELAAKLRATVEEAAQVIENLTAARMAERLTIQNYHVSGLEAVLHVVEHFSMHTGQVIFATKMLTGEDLGFYAHLRANASAGASREGSAKGL